ncbi:MAG: DegT/DnrJ/EryC1/StrS family aminotransferase [Actinobacteria bacterium]|nr:DegT/DnrJ/EryC1/StrS family aminotransferase [Actinomycetota bacterium]
MVKRKPEYKPLKPVRGDFLIFGSPLLMEDEIREVVDTMRSCWIGTGPKVHEFEEEFKKYIGSGYAVAVNSCTSGMHIALESAGVGSGDEVITTPMTFCATANVIIHAGGIPVFADIDKDSLNINPDEIENKITEKTKAILPVHYTGRPCNMDRILKLAKKYDLKVISDCAHAIESEYHGMKVGNIGDFSVFSFYVTKNLTTGEGGMITLNNPGCVDKLRALTLHGLNKDAWKRYSDEGYKHYYVIAPGYKYNMTDMQASIGIHQLRRIDKNWGRRLDIWERYNKAFKDLPVKTPAEFEQNTRHALHLYTLVLEIEKIKTDRDGILNALYRENIGTGVHFIAIHLHPYYKKRFGYKKEDFPVSSYVSDRTISIPFSAKLSDKDVEDVIFAVRRVLDYYS